MFGATRITSPAYQKWSTRNAIKFDEYQLKFNLKVLDMNLI